MPKYRLVAPNGAPIDAILSHKTIVCREGIDAESFFKDGAVLGWDWNDYTDEDDIDGTDGERSYEIAETGERLFEDEGGGRWPESQCKLEAILDDDWFEEKAAEIGEDIL